MGNVGLLMDSSEEKVFRIEINRSNIIKRYCFGKAQRGEEFWLNL